MCGLVCVYVHVDEGVYVWVDRCVCGGMVMCVYACVCMFVRACVHVCACVCMSV
jgi:hypothetical protein